jgi:hypothetical protein
MLQLGCWNINGFSSQKLLDVNIEKFDIFGIVESWISGDSHVNLPGEFIHEPGFKKKGKRGRRSGGIILYFKKKLAENKTGTKVHSTKYFVWIKLDKALCGTSHDIYKIVFMI